MLLVHHERMQMMEVLKLRFAMLNKKLDEACGLQRKDLLILRPEKMFRSVYIYDKDKINYIMLIKSCHTLK